MPLLTKNRKEKQNNESKVIFRKNEKVESNKKEKVVKKVGNTKVGKKDVEKLNRTSFYAEKIINKITDGKTVQSSPFEVSYNKILSEEKTTRIIYLVRLPENIKPQYLSNLENTIQNILGYDKTQFSVDIEDHSFPYKENFHDKRVIANRKNTLSRRDTTRQSLSEMKDVYNSTEKMSYRISQDMIDVEERKLKLIERKLKSFDTLYNYQEKGGRVLKEYKFLRVNGETIEICDKVTKQLIEVLTAQGYTLKEILNLEQYLKIFGVASLKRRETVAMDIIPTTPPSLVSNLSLGYTEGIVRSAQPKINIGNSIKTNYTVDVSFSETQDAANIMIVASSGSGKTVMAKYMGMFIVPHYYMDIMDYKGGEWIEYCRRMKDSVIISFASDRPAFINTLIIPDAKTFGMKNPKASYSISLMFTTRMLEVMVGKHDNPKKVTAFCTDIIKKAYLSKRIDPTNPTTYRLSNDTVFDRDLWEALEDLLKDPNTYNNHNKEIISDVKSALEVYLSSTGERNIIFQNQVNLADVLDKRVVVYEYGAQASADQIAVPEDEIILKALQQDYLVSLRTAKRKLDGEFLVEFLEECQRLITNPIYRRQFNHKATGSRSSNKINIFLFNTIGSLLNIKDDLDISAIKENINGLMVGRLKDDAMEEVIRFFGLQYVADELNLVAQNKGIYKRSFFVQYDFTEKPLRSIVSARIPSDIVDGPLFESRSVSKNDFDEDVIFS